jgi:hypothetical protein
MNKLMLLAIIFTLVMSLGFVIACGDDDDDDDDDATDDDDTAADDDDAVSCNYTDELTWAYNTCEFVLQDTDGVDMDLTEAIADCNTCVGECAYAWIDDEDCDAALECVNAPEGGCF